MSVEGTHHSSAGGRLDEERRALSQSTLTKP
jgi:hypothetical protein